MIQSITVLTSSGNHNIDLDAKTASKQVIDLSLFTLLDGESFDIKIEFYEPVAEFRDHDYSWEKIKKHYIANELSPKIIRLQSGQMVQSNLTAGIWEINPKESTILLWRFNPEFASPITNYLENNNSKIISPAKQKFYFIENPTLLFPKEHAIELSRSKSPFSGIACFTDHCDFDTAKNLVLQREFFNEHQIKVTKGFFLNHFSKREDNASFQNQKEEILKWHNDGHELCYHSLSQSIKTDLESFEDFKGFMPPLNNLKVWIDHGFQPYNFSLLKKSNLKERDFEEVLSERNINTLWNYIDSGTATNGVINQFNTKHFTLSSFLKGNKDLGLIKKAQLIIKNIIFHYYNDEDLLLKYKNTASSFKKVFIQKNIKSFFPLIKDFFKLSKSILFVLLFWNTAKNEPYKLAKYSPIVFKHIIAEKEFYIFQTLEMLDFKKSLSQENINILIKEKGVFIAHTYFSVPMEYHAGKLFSTPTTIDEKVSQNFKFLGEKIHNKEIWNPTLTQLINYWSGFEKVVFDIDFAGNIFEKSKAGLQMRKVI
ncbi:hypothetical protein B0A79_13660 [Flavobacterium piscis]|uniref:NodB homology domain-containing protein n=1 Tax=Flavobacterium piscis TaxID=1114874 RepID=A0ABX2XES2_9FLAO|nr:hypothetical protein [Flavobacterium piscis]OCB70603.1 hypothetical protein FLP_18170 [Flavobacterium piscis]OXG03729.1 hypothetical protein B0A79_13660 [Flavobacterium piscis]